MPLKRLLEVVVVVEEEVVLVVEAAMEVVEEMEVEDTMDTDTKYGEMCFESDG